jgi:hypothetical protein
VFLECPYYSITRFNKFKITNSNSKTGTNKYYQRNAIAASRADKQVCCMVDYFNNHLRLINRNCGTPRISQDIIASCKGARAERTVFVYLLTGLPYLNSTCIYILVQGFLAEYTSISYIYWARLPCFLYLLIGVKASLSHYPHESVFAVKLEQTNTTRGMP